MDKTIVVLDTNIFISAVFWEGKSYSVVKKAINQEIIVFISNYIRVDFVNFEGNSYKPYLESPLSQHLSLKRRNESFILKLSLFIVKVVRMSMYPDIKEQVNTKLILDTLRKNGRMRRSDVYREVLHLRKKRDDKNLKYQVICRDVQRLLDHNLIKVVSGGKRSQVLSLK